MEGGFCVDRVACTRAACNNRSSAHGGLFHDLYSENALQLARNVVSMEPEINVQRSYPLSALFVLVAACAVVFALLTPVVRSVATGDVGVVEAATASAGGALCAMLIGAVIGLHHYRPLRGLGWGTLTGGIIGMLVGPVTLSPGTAFGSLVTMSLGGAAVLLITATALGLSMKSQS